MRKVQKRVTDVILEKSKSAMLGGKQYRVAPPTIGTLIMVSEMISDLPEFESTGKESDVMRVVLANAQNSRPVCEICAVLILGAKKLKKHPVLGQMRLKRLTRKIFMNASPKEVQRMLRATIYGLELSDFFSLTTFLKGLNVTEPTKVETETEATVSGQQ